MPNPHILKTIPGRIELVASSDDRAQLLIYGNIGDDWFGSSVPASEVVQQLDAITASTINVRINSYGGCAIDGLAIYNALKRHPARIEVTVDGLAASAASVIAMAGDSVEMPANAIMMIHAPSGGVLGHAKDIEQYLPALRTIEASMAAIYASKSGATSEEMLALIRRYEDVYYTAEEAKEAGFCDVVTSDSTATARAERAFARVAAEPAFDSLLGAMPDRIAATLTSIKSGDRRGDASMPNTNTLATITPAQRQEIVAAERERVSQIRAALKPHSNGARGGYYREIADQAIANGDSFDEFGRKMLSALGESGEPLNAGAGISTNDFSNGHGMQLQTGGRDSAFVQAASDVIAMRGGVRIDKPHAGAREIRSMSLSDIARACLTRSDRDRGLSGPAAIRAALSTSDFPAILGDTIGKALRRGYEQEPGTHSAWVLRSTVPDFKEQTRSILGAMPDLLLVLEGGEYKHGAMDEDKSVPFRVEKFGRIVEVTWEMLVNDDLGALTRFPQGLGQAARRKEADLVYSLFDGSGQVMQDGVALFNDAHGNLATSTADLDEVALAKGRLLMRKQTSIGGGALNLTPKFLLVPPELEGQAEKILAASSIHVSSGLENATPEWIRRLQLIVESRLPDNAAYLLAGNNQVDTVELAYLDEDNGPVVDEEDGFDNDTKKFKVRLATGARFLDWRGTAKLPISA